MTDRELLELAAKAAGLDRPNYIQDGFALGWQKASGIAVESGATSGRLWNPITDDGDAFRLAVKLHLCLLFPMRGDTYKQCGAGQVGGSQPACMEHHDPDPYAATRRAIVRAAAEIGRNKND